MARFWVDGVGQRVLVMGRDECEEVAVLVAQYAGDDGPLLSVLDALAPVEDEAYARKYAQEVRG